MSISNINQKLTHQKVYFNKIAPSYHKSAGYNLKSMIRFKKATSRFISGNVLDIGSGGIIGYDLTQTKHLTLADIAPETLKNPLILKGKDYIPADSTLIKTIEANVLNLPFAKNSFDTVIMITTAHHLTEISLAKTKQNIQSSFKHINFVLKKNGVFIIHECFLHPIIKLIQEVFFEIFFTLLEKFGKPLPYFMSERQLGDYLTIAGFQIIKIHRIKSDKIVYIPLFPSLSPPGWLWDVIQPSKVYICSKIRGVEQH